MLLVLTILYSMIIHTINYYIHNHLFEEVDAETLEEILAFIYNGRIALNANNVKELLAAADFMEIQQLVPHCAAFLKDLQITPVVALEIRSLYEMLRHITELEPAVANADIYIKVW